MVDYQKLYTLLFNRITDVLRQLENERDAMRTFNAIAVLKQAQMDAEELYLSFED